MINPKKSYALSGAALLEMQALIDFLRRDKNAEIARVMGLVSADLKEIVEDKPEDATAVD